MITKAFTDFDESSQVLARWSRYPTALIGHSCKLIQITTDRAQLGNGLLEYEELIFGQWSQRTEVSPKQHGRVSRSSHAASTRSSIEQHQVIWGNTHTEPTTERATLDHDVCGRIRRPKEHSLDHSCKQR